MSTVSDFVNLLATQVDRGIYVWGGNGEAVSAMSNPTAWIERRETSEENVKRDLALLEKRKAAGVDPIQAFDCSGLVYWALHTLGALDHDLSSRGLYSACDPITESDLRTGDLVFHHDGKQIVHVGVWIDGEQIECKGRDVGVVRNKRRSGYWNRFGRYPKLKPDDPEPTPEPTHKYVKVIGGSVRVREGNGPAYPQIGTAHNAKWYKEHKIKKDGDILPCYGQADADPHWYEIDFEGKRGFITSNSRYTEVIYKV